MSEIVHIIDTDVRVVEYEGQRVVTLRQIDDLHQRAEGQARKQFNAHRQRFMEGRDYFTLTSSEIRTMSLEGLFPPRTARGHLLTESGYQKVVVKGWRHS